MATTTYKIFANDELVGTKSKKQTATELAKAERKARNAGVRVETGTGTVVFEMAAPKKIKMTPKYQRVQDLPEGVTVPDGFRVAYVRPRRNGAILHNPEEGYRIMALDSGELLEDEFETTREAGARLKEGVTA